MLEAILHLLHLIETVRSLSDLIEVIRAYPQMFLGLAFLVLAGSLVAILIRRSPKKPPLTIR
jgi:hypothetical protein